MATKRKADDALVDSETLPKRVRSDSEVVDLRHQELAYQEALWNSVIREILFQCPCTAVWQCVTTQGRELVTFDHLDKHKILTIGKLQLPVDLLTMMQLIKSLITHVEYAAVIMSRTKILHAGLPEPEHVAHKYYYHFGKKLEDLSE